MNRTGLRLIFIAICCANILACSNTDPIMTHNETSRIDQNLITDYLTPNSPAEEYIARVGKRVLIVSDQPHTHYKFLVSTTTQAEIQLDKTNNSITVSQGLLEILNDEAELAATLTIAMSKMAYYPDLDRNAMITLARAGYDPLAMVDLQEQYYYAAEHNQSHWLKTIYSLPPTDTAISINKAFASKMSKGLLRGSETYQKQIKGS